MLWAAAFYAGGLSYDIDVGRRAARHGRLLPIARNAAVVEAGLDLKVTPQAALGLSYHGQMANCTSQRGFNANFTLRL